MIKRLLITLSTCTLAFSSLQAASLVDGTEIGFDFGSAGTVAAPDTPNWNVNLAALSGTINAGSLIDTSGVVVDGVGFTWSGATASGTQGDFISGTPAVIPETAALDNLVANAPGGSLVLTLTGLDDALLYDITVGHGNDAASGNTDTTWTITGTAFSFTTDASVGANAYAQFSGVSTNGSGQIEITSAGAGGNLNISAVSGLYVAAIPEQSTYALIGGLLAMGLAINRRRKR